MSFLLFWVYAILGTAVFWAICNAIRLDKRNPFAFIISTFLYGIVLAYFVSYYSASSEYRWLYYVFGGFIALSGNYINLLCDRGIVKEEAGVVFSLITLLIYVIGMFVIHAGR
jgi:hypothetical protein